MRRKLPWILLAISLMVNLGFVFGVLQAQQQADRLSLVPDARAEAVAERLALTEAQRAELETLRDSLRSRMEAARASGEREAQRRRLLAELAKPDYDQAAVETLLAEQSTQRAASWTEMNREVHAFLQRLDAEQREAFFSLAAEDWSFLRALMFPHWTGRRG